MDKRIRSTLLREGKVVVVLILVADVTENGDQQANLSITAQKSFPKFKV